MRLGFRKGTSRAGFPFTQSVLSFQGPGENPMQSPHLVVCSFGFIAAAIAENANCIDTETVKWAIGERLRGARAICSKNIFSKIRRVTRCVPGSRCRNAGDLKCSTGMGYASLIIPLFPSILCLGFAAQPVKCPIAGARIPQPPRHQPDWASHPAIADTRQTWSGTSRCIRLPGHVTARAASHRKGLEKFRSVLNTVDTNKDGKISQSEFMTACQKGELKNIQL
jgi:hypothetical protein